MIVCIDSNIIIWGIKKQITAGQEADRLIERAEYFFKWVDADKIDVLIPSIVLAEILAPEPENLRAEYYNILSKNFIIVNFDERTAFKYAQLVHGRFDELKKAAIEADISRNKMKIDHMIVACAMVNNANCIYSHDNGLKKFAADRIDVRELPHPPPRRVENTLFGDLPITM
jgi:hypothetical protein